MGNTIHLHFPNNYDKSLMPVPAVRARDWWENTAKTKNHARHCLPLVMANSLGYYILSPGTFLVRWNGDPTANAEIEIIERSSHCEVDNHAALGSFTVQAAFVPRTDDQGDFVYIKGVANETPPPYVCMEACIEAWWNPGNFGLVYLINQPGEFLVRKGQPIAQMLLLREPHPALVVDPGPVPHSQEWGIKRRRPDYRKDLDYMKGRLPDGTKVPAHVTNWKAQLSDEMAPRCPVGREPEPE